MQDESLITYEKLYEILRLEKYKKEIQKLDQDLLEKIIRYLNEKKIILQGYEIKSNMFSSQGIEKTKRQLENARLLLRELYERREGKIIQLALFNSRTNSPLQDPDALLEEEKQLYNTLLNELSGFRAGIIDKILEGKKPEIELTTQKEKTGNKIIRFLQEVPQFVGEDMNTYGPYKPEELGNIPQKVAEILIKNSMAEGI